MASRGDPTRSGSRSALPASLAVLAWVLGLTPVSARADDGTLRAPELSAPELEPEPPRITNPNRHWQPHWERFNAAGAVLIAAAEGAAFAVYFAEPVREAHWTSRLPLDDELRSALRLDSEQDRDAVVVASDGIFGIMMGWPVLVDAVFLAGIVHHDDDMALQMALIDAEAFAIAHMVTWLTSRLAGRVRPEALECGSAGTCGIDGSGPYASFVGGHSLMAFTSAGLVCSHHAENPWLTGGPEGAGAACASGLALATIVSFMRIGVDRHWASDIGFGALIGAAIGFGVPYGLHYARPRPRRTETSEVQPVQSLSIRPGSEAGPLGVTATGAF